MSRTVLMAVGLAALLAGCGQRQAIETTRTTQLEDVPNDSGGYAGAMAEPPAERAVVDVESNIAAGQMTDSKDPLRPEPEAEDKAHAEEQAEPAKPATKDTSGDSLWESNSQPVAAFQTNQGVVYLELWPDVAPKHAANLIKLVKAKFYDGIYIHRVEPGFVVQLGDPLTKTEGPQGPQVGTGGPGWTVPAEFSTKPHLRGTLSMARSTDPNSAGSQFFWCLDRLEQLDNQYTVFGRILGDGMDIVDKLKVGDQVQFAWMVKE